MIVVHVVRVKYLTVLCTYVWYIYKLHTLARYNKERITMFFVFFLFFFSLSLSNLNFMSHRETNHLLPPANPSKSLPLKTHTHGCSSICSTKIHRHIVSQTSDSSHKDWGGTTIEANNTNNFLFPCLTDLFSCRLVCSHIHHYNHGKFNFPWLNSEMTTMMIIHLFDICTYSPEN